MEAFRAHVPNPTTADLRDLSAVLTNYARKLQPKKLLRGAAAADPMPRSRRGVESLPNLPLNATMPSSRPVAAADEAAPPVGSERARSVSAHKRADRPQAVNFRKDEWHRICVKQGSEFALQSKQGKLRKRDEMAAAKQTLDLQVGNRVTRDTIVYRPA